MPFKLPDKPSPRAYVEELADYLEILALKSPDGRVSGQEASRVLNRFTDELDNDGIDSEEDAIKGEFQRALSELERRKTDAGGHYPFEVAYASVETKQSDYFFLYIFLLLCTRLNMSQEKTKAGLDATALFEELCACALSFYLGHKSKSLVFGTSANGGFGQRLLELKRQLGEEHTTSSPLSTGNAQDDGLDIVGWLGFKDKNRGQLVVFGQCKTGSEVDMNITKLLNFCKNWFMPAISPSPVLAWFVADTLYRDKQDFDRANEAILFNRFRIMENLDYAALPKALLGKIEEWTKQALEDLKNAS